jgi:hypothetical protein
MDVGHALAELSDEEEGLQRVRRQLLRVREEQQQLQRAQERAKGLARLLGAAEQREQRLHLLLQEAKEEAKDREVQAEAREQAEKVSGCC